MELKELLQKSGINTQQIASDLNISKSAVYQALRGEYQGKKDVSQKIEDYLVKKIAAGQQSPNFLTSGQKQVLTILHYTLQDKEFAIVTGPSGVGKSYACREFCNKRPGCLYLKMIDGMSYGDVVDSLLEPFSVHVKGPIHRRFLRLIQVLKDNDVKMVIADEADLFTKGSSATFLKKVSIFREIYEAGIGVMLVGLPDLEKKLRDSEERYIYSRIGYARKLKGIEPDELEQFWIHLGGPETNEVAKVIRHATCKAYLRTLKTIINRSKLDNFTVVQACGLLFE